MIFERNIPTIETDAFRVEMLKAPTADDWEWVRICTLNTMGLKPKNSATDEWKRKLIESEHSPANELTFGFRLTIPYWVSVHLVRHHVGVSHYVQSQRNDRQDRYDRNSAPQGEMVSHVISLDTAALVHMSHKRLCMQASDFTRRVVSAMCDLVTLQYPEFSSVLVPLCEYRNGKCTEFYPCGKAGE